MFQTNKVVTVSFEKDTELESSGLFSDASLCSPSPVDRPI